MPHVRTSFKLGFTLVEILLVMMLLAIMATVAVRSYINSSETFGFLAGYKESVSLLKNARSYALTNKAINDVVPESYGVRIKSNEVMLFADNGSTPFEYDVTPPPDGKIADSVLSTYALPAGFTLSALDPQADLNMPLYFYYKSGDGNLTVKNLTNDIITKSSRKYVTLEFAEDVGDLKRYIVIFQISGLPEEFVSAPNL